MQAKVVKGYNHLETSDYLKLHISDKPLIGYSITTLTINATTQAYYEGREMGYYKFAKPCPNTRFAFATVASLATKDILVTKGFPSDGVFLHTNVTNRMVRMKGITTKSTCHAQSLALMIVVREINTCYAQDLVSTTLHTLMREGNISDISFSVAKGDVLNYPNSIAFIQCLNAATYTMWRNCRHIPLLGKFVDLASNKHSLMHMPRHTYLRPPNNGSHNESWIHQPPHPTCISTTS